MPKAIFYPFKGDYIGFRESFRDLKGGIPADL